VEGFFWLPLEAMGAWPTAGIDSTSRISLRIPNQHDRGFRRNVTGDSVSSWPISGSLRIPRSRCGIMTATRKPHFTYGSSVWPRSARQQTEGW